MGVTAVQFTNSLRLLGYAACTLLAVAGPACASGVTVTGLTSDTAAPPLATDPHLVNAWGMSFAPGGPWWISDNGTGLTTVYDGSGRVFQYPQR